MQIAAEKIRWLQIKRINAFVSTGAYSQTAARTARLIWFRSISVLFPFCVKQMYGLDSCLDAIYTPPDLIRRRQIGKYLLMLVLSLVNSRRRAKRSHVVHWRGGPPIIFHIWNP